MNRVHSAVGCWLAVGLLEACASPRPVEPKPVVRTPMLGDQFVQGEPSGLRRADPEDAPASGLVDFLGEGARGYLACGVRAASRVEYAASASDVELVALLLRFDDANHARCGYDVGRAPEHEVLDPHKALTADVRPLASPSGERVVVTLLKGPQVVRIFAAGSAAGVRAAKALAQEQGAALSGEGGDSALWNLMPSGYLVGNSTRVVAAGPFGETDGPLWGTALYSCLEGEEVRAFSTVFPDEDAADAQRSAFQLRAAHEKQTVTAFKLGETRVTGALDPATGRETLLLRQGAAVSVLLEVPSRRNCAPVIEALAQLAPR